MSRSKDIQKLLSDEIMKAPEMTHSLKKIGNGSMKRGFINMTDAVGAEREEKGFKKGGVAVFALMAGAWGIREIIGYVKRHKDNKENTELLLKNLDELKKEREENIEEGNGESIKNEKEDN